MEDLDRRLIRQQSLQRPAFHATTSSIHAATEHELIVPALLIVRRETYRMGSNSSSVSITSSNRVSKQSWPRCLGTLPCSLASTRDRTSDFGIRACNDDQPRNPQTINGQAGKTNSSPCVLQDGPLGHDDTSTSHFYSSLRQADQKKVKRCNRRQQMHPRYLLRAKEGRVQIACGTRLLFFQVAIVWF